MYLFLLAQLTRQSYVLFGRKVPMRVLKNQKRQRKRLRLKYYVTFPAEKVPCTRKCKEKLDFYVPLCQNT